MNLKNINKKLLSDNRLVAVAGLTESEKEILKWLQEVMERKETEINLTMPKNVDTIANSVMNKLYEVARQTEKFFGFEIVRQFGKEHFYIMDSSNKIVGRIQYVDDKV